MARYLSLTRMVLMALLLVQIASAVDAQTFTTFDVPNSTATIPIAINRSGDIAGVYDYNSFLRAPANAFLRERDGTITTFDIAGSPGCSAGP